MSLKTVGDVYAFLLEIQMDATTQIFSLEYDEETLKNQSDEAKLSIERSKDLAELVHQAATEGLDLIIPLLQILEAWRRGVPDDAVAHNLQAYLDKVET